MIHMNVEVLRGSGLKCFVPWCPPPAADNQDIEVYSYELQIKADKQTYKLPVAFDEEGRRPLVDITPDFSMSLPSGEWQYVLMATAGAETFPASSGLMTIRELGEITLAAQTLRCLEEELLRRVQQGNAFVTRYALPGGVNVDHQSVAEIMKQINYMKWVVRQEGGEFFQDSGWGAGYYNGY